MKYTILLFTFFTPLCVFTQIQVGGEESKEEQEKESKKENIEVVKEKVDSSSETEIYFGTNYSRTYRVIEVNEGLFGDSIGIRSEETPVPFFSFDIGMRTRLNNFLEFDAGISFLQNGEQFEYTETDSLYKYSNTYRYIGMPLKLNVVYGESLLFYGGVGVIPQMTLHRVYAEEWRSKNDERGTFDEQTTQDLSSFVLSFTGTAGVKYYSSTGWGMYAAFTYRSQLSSTYDKTHPYIHKGNAVGASIGVLKRL